MHRDAQGGAVWLSLSVGVAGLAGCGDGDEALIAADRDLYAAKARVHSGGAGRSVA